MDSMKRLLKYGTNTLITIIMVIAILIIVMLISYNNSKRFDLTQSKKYTLSDQTLKLLKNLDKKITFEVFFSRGSNFKNQAADLLDQYKHRSKRIVIDYKETDKNPVLARDYKLTQPNSIVVKTGERKEVITTVSENAVTNSIFDVTRSGKRVVYFTAGHGERSPASKENPDLAIAKQDLEGEQYVTKTIKLVEKDKVPEDCNLLIIAGPKTAFFPHEIEIIKKYVDSGGSVMILFEPLKNNPQLVAMLKEKGLIVGKDIVIDKISKLMGGRFYMPVVTPPNYGKHPIVRGFKLMTIFPMARSIQVQRKLPKGVNWTPIARTTAGAPHSWAETDRPRKGSKIQYDKGKDVPGPIILGCAGIIREWNTGKKEDTGKKDKKKEQKIGRMIVFGSVDFISTQYVRHQGNMNLFLNSVGWATKQEERISISRPRRTASSPLYLKDADKKKIWLFSVVLLPGIIIITGITFHFLRR